MAGRYISAILLFVAHLIETALAARCLVSPSSYTYITCSDICCSSGYGCCTSTYWNSNANSYVDTASTALKGWVIGVIVVGCVIGISIIVCIIVCIVQATKSATRGTVIHPATAQPTVTVVSSGQQASSGQGYGGASYPTSYGPPGTVPPAYPYSSADAAPNHNPK